MGGWFGLREWMKSSRFDIKAGRGGTSVRRNGLSLHMRAFLWTLVCWRMMISYM